MSPLHFMEKLRISVPQLKEPTSLSSGILVMVPTRQPGQEICRTNIMSIYKNLPFSPAGRLYIVNYFEK